MREMRPDYANNTALQLALRELRLGFSSWRQWAGIVATIFLLTLSGPFQSYSALSLWQRALYWAVTVIACFALGSFIATWVRMALAQKRIPQPWMFLTIGIASGAPVSIIVLLINWVTYGADVLDGLFVLQIFGYAIVVSTAIAGFFTLIHTSPARAAHDKEPEENRLLQRLAFDKRGGIISISVSDHYVEVTTTKGKDLLLMRLGDAIAECPTNGGLQIHRSHWVAFEGIEVVHRRNGKLEVLTKAGQTLPVSRTFMNDVRAAGLIS